MAIDFTSAFRYCKDYNDFFVVILNKLNSTPRIISVQWRVLRISMDRKIGMLARCAAASCVAAP
jgi:hypothetical protein